MRSKLVYQILGGVHTVKVPHWGGTHNASLATLKNECLRHVGLALTNVRHDTVERSMAIINRLRTKIQLSTAEPIYIGGTHIIEGEFPTDRRRKQKKRRDISNDQPEFERM